MTTIVYDGRCRTFYADTLISSRRAHLTIRTESAFKVEDLTDLKLVTEKGERIIAAGFSGAIPGMSGALRFVLSHMYRWKETKTNIETLGGRFDFGSLSLTLATNKNVWMFQFSPDQLTVDKCSLDEVAVTGSGGAFAMGAIKVYGATGLEALQAASICDEATGSVVNSFKIVGNKIHVLPLITIDDTEELRLKMRRNSARSKSFVGVRSFRVAPRDRMLSNVAPDARWVKDVKETIKKRRVANKAAKVKAKEPTETTAKPAVKPKNATKAVKAT